MIQRVTRPTLLILDFLLARHRDGERPTWGFEIASETGLKGGTVYPVLSRLAGEAWVESFWDDSVRSGPRRRLYRLTPAGVRGARELLERHTNPGTSLEEMRWIPG